MTTTADPQTDGRFQRSERSREAIVQALLELVGEHVLEPTAQQVAERADVGVRTVFRHFSDMDTLFAAMDERLSERALEILVDSVQTGTLAERVDGLVSNRAKLFTLIEPYRRAQARVRHRSVFLNERHEIFLRKKRDDLHRWLPEIEDADPEIRNAFEVTLSFAVWDRLRSDQRLSVRKAEAVVRRMLRRLANDLEPAD